MVSFWPWKGDSSSTASFEKTLSTLSTKIADTQTRLDKTRASSRRVRVIWTLYLSFAYLVYAIVLLLVVGHKSMGSYEWTGLAGGPVLIYGTRTLLSTYYNYRIESLSARLKEQQEERAKTIQKLKDATKYDSTLELIEKYGGAEGTPKKGKQQGPGEDEGKDGASPQAQQGKKSRQSQGQLPGRTTMAPPPTANIQRGPDGMPRSPQSPPPKANSMEPGAEFAPNADYTQPPSMGAQAPPLHQTPAYPANQQQQPVGMPESHWYDRIFDVLLGEDETAPKNRIVLICKACRLVNGQAPPGIKTLAEMGTWRCMACGASNGEEAEDEGQRIVREVLGEKQQKDQEQQQAAPDTDASTSDENTHVERVQPAEASKLKQRKKKGTA